MVAVQISEGFPYSLIEAMTCGRACVATDVGGVTEALGDDAGLVVPPRNPAALAAACVTLLRDDDKRATLGAAARERALEHFTVDRAVATGFDEIYTHTGSSPDPAGEPGQLRRGRAFRSGVMTSQVSDRTRSSRRKSGSSRTSTSRSPRRGGRARAVRGRPGTVGRGAGARGGRPGLPAEDQLVESRPSASAGRSGARRRGPRTPRRGSRSLSRTTRSSPRRKTGSSPSDRSFRRKSKNSRRKTRRSRQQAKS